tara:strand:- start:4104 stop:4493 length:390 start_codon:yes stop_codon:yes gene_type:complete
MANRQRYWFIDSGKGDRIGIVERVANAQTREGVTTNYQPISEVKPVIIYSESTDADLVDSTNTGFANIPDRFIQGIVSKVIADSYRDPRSLNIEASQMFEIEWVAFNKAAKQWKRSSYTKVGSITPHEF